MTSLRTPAALAGLISALAAAVLAGSAAAQTPRDLLSETLKPTVKGVEYDTPTDPPAVDACKIETVYNAEKKAIGYALRDGQGKMLRRFVDADAKGGMDQWSYYQDGFEVYRESDLDGDRSPDEARWLNSAGTRVASLARGKVTGWKRISAEEASKVLVQGLVTPDLSLIETVMATPGELAGLGVPKAEVERVAAAASKRLESVRSLMEKLVGWNKKTVWNRLDGMMPHLIPGDATTGLPRDLVLYENAVVFAGPPAGQPSPAGGKLAFLQVPEMIQVGETWKFVELPRPIDPETPVVASEGGVRSSVYRQSAGPQAESPEVEAALKALAQYDGAGARVQAEGSREELAQFHHRRIPLLRAVVEAAKNPDEQLAYNRQIVDSLAAAYQTGHYPAGLKLLDGLARQGGKLAAYASFRKVTAEFTARNDEPGANLMASQKAWMADLKGFLDAFPKSDEAAEAMIQLAGACEFNAEEDEARGYYQRLAREFPETDAGKKAAGAMRRLDLVGKPFELRGPGLGGQEIDASRYRGKALLVAFWASWASRAESGRKDLPELVKLYQAYRGKGFEILGVNLDAERADLDAFLKETPLPWPQVFEPGGIEKNRFATEYGIISLPTMLLVDPQGKVVNRSLRTSAEVERQLEKILPVKQAGVALDRQE